MNATTITRAAYLNGDIDHATYYEAVSDALGRSALESFVRHIMSGEDLPRCLKQDPHLNQIPLRRWEAFHGSVQALVRHEHMAMTYGGQLPPRTVCWSLSESVCVLKATAARMARESTMKRIVTARILKQDETGLYSVQINHDGPIVLSDESYEVASAVAQALVDGASGTTEADEVAESILRSLDNSQ